MSEKGECLDNAVAERFFGSLKREWTSHGYYATRQEARDDIIDYIEMFYHSRRKHSYLGYVSPNTYEQFALLSVFASTTGPADGPLRGKPGRGIDIQVTEDVVLDGLIGTNVLTNVAAGVGSGGVRVRAKHLDIRHEAEIQSIVFRGSTGGKGGDIDVDAQSVLIRDDGLIRATTGGAGDGAHVNIRTKTLELRDGGIIFAQAFGGTGNGGTSL